MTARPFQTFAEDFGIALIENWSKAEGPESPYAIFEMDGPSHGIRNLKFISTSQLFSGNFEN